MSRAWIALAFALGWASLARAGDGIFGNGFEALPPAQLIVHYPAGAQSMAVRGSGGGLSWAQGTPMLRSGDTFTLALPDLAASIAWKPVLGDATLALGPDYTVAPGETVEVWPRFTTSLGQVQTLFPAFQSALLGNTRAIHAYLPPTYLENPSARFPVVYMHDGENLWAAHPEWAFGGQPLNVDTAFDTGANDGSIREAIVIGIASTPNRLYELTPTSDPDYPNTGGGDLYLRMVVEELKPAVDAALRTRTDVASTGMAGTSLGGLLTVHAGRTRPQVFGRIAALSPSTWWDDSRIVADVQSTPPAPARPLRVYVDSGDSGSGNDSVTTTNALADAYLGAGFVAGADFLHVVQAGATHSQVYWAQRLPGAMQFLLGPD